MTWMTADKADALAASLNEQADDGERYEAVHTDGLSYIVLYEGDEEMGPI